MKRYGIRYKHSDGLTFATLYLTPWGHIAKWLRLPNPQGAKFTELGE